MKRAKRASLNIKIFKSACKVRYCFLFLRVLKCFTSPGSLLPCGRSMRFTQRGFPIRTSPDQRLFDTSPKLIAVTPRPSSPFEAKASTIRPCSPSQFCFFLFFFLSFPRRFPISERDLELLEIAMPLVRESREPKHRKHENLLCS